MKIKAYLGIKFTDVIAVLEKESKYSIVCRIIKP